MVCRVVGNEKIKNPKAKIVKFSSPMCSECKEMEIELTKAMENYKDSVLIEEINVVENVGKGVKYNTTMQGRAVFCSSLITPVIPFAFP